MERKWHVWMLESCLILVMGTTPYIMIAVRSDWMGLKATVSSVVLGVAFMLLTGFLLKIRRHDKMTAKASEMADAGTP